MGNTGMAQGNSRNENLLPAVEAPSVFAYIAQILVEMGLLMAPRCRVAKRPIRSVCRHEVYSYTVGAGDCLRYR